MARPHPALRLLTGGTGLILALGALGACAGSTEEDADLVAQAQAVQVRAEEAEQAEIERRAALLPQPAAGTVVIAGETRSALLDALLRSYRRGGPSATVDVEDSGADQAYDRLCGGEVDLVSAAREISRDEWEACRDVGLEVVQFQVAAEAIVVAIKSESDVGGDCLSTQQLQDVFRAGSPVTSWEQVGLDAVPLRTAGRAPGNRAFDFFGQSVLDAPQPSLVNLRSDYEALGSDQEAREFVVGRLRDKTLAATSADRQRSREEQRSELTARAQVLRDAVDEVRVARAEVEKGIRDGRPADQQARDAARLDAALQAFRTARAEHRDARARWRTARARAVVAERAARRYQAVVGHVAYFRFSYYELFEDQLRPFEVTRPDGERNCVFPSQRTIVSGEYPLARRQLLTTTVRSLGRPEVSGLLESYLEGSVAAAEETQLVALPDSAVAQQLRVVRGEDEPPLVVPEAPAGASSTPAPSDEPVQ